MHVKRDAERVHRAGEFPQSRVDAANLRPRFQIFAIEFRRHIEPLQSGSLVPLPIENIREVKMNLRKVVVQHQTHSQRLDRRIEFPLPRKPLPLFEPFQSPPGGVFLIRDRGLGRLNGRIRGFRHGWVEIEQPLTGHCAQSPAIIAKRQFAILRKQLQLRQRLGGISHPLFQPPQALSNFVDGHPFRQQLSQPLGRRDLLQVKIREPMNPTNRSDQTLSLPSANIMDTDRKQLAHHRRGINLGPGRQTVIESHETKPFGLAGDPQVHPVTDQSLRLLQFDGRMSIRL